MKRKDITNVYKMVNIVTVISTIIFVFINLENFIYYLADLLWPPIKPSESLHARYQYWLEDIYGREKGFEIYWNIRGFTLWIIEHGINIILFVVITLMMIASIWLIKKKGKKINCILLAYFILCFIFMFVMTFDAGPLYVSMMRD